MYISPPGKWGLELLPEILWNKEAAAKSIKTNHEEMYFGEQLYFLRIYDAMNLKK